MKRFFYKILLLIVIVIGVDRGMGSVLEYISNHATSGYTGKNNYICDKGTEDVLIFGSSRASHHYNPFIIEDSLGLSCYNCGQDGNGIFLAYGRLLMFKERKQPKLIIYDVQRFFDLFKFEDNAKYLGYLKPKYERSEVASIIKSIDAKEQYKMCSKLYRYNSTFVADFFSFISISDRSLTKGYEPFPGQFDRYKVKESPKEDSYQFDSLKLHYLNKFIDQSKGSKIVFVHSPLWYGLDSAAIAPIKTICKQRNIDFIDFSNSEKYVHNNDYFKDGGHLNSKGADEFTRDLVVLLKSKGICDDWTN